MSAGKKTNVWIEWARGPNHQRCLAVWRPLLRHTNVTFFRSSLTSIPGLFSFPAPANFKGKSPGCELTPAMNYNWAIRFWNISPSSSATEDFPIKNVTCFRIAPNSSTLYIFTCESICKEECLVSSVQQSKRKKKYNFQSLISFYILNHMKIKSPGTRSHESNLK